MLFGRPLTEGLSSLEVVVVRLFCKQNKNLKIFSRAKEQSRMKIQHFKYVRERHLVKPVLKKNSSMTIGGEIKY
jgi:hypothetical protein